MELKEDIKMMEPPLVTIAVPVYGVESYIERCARSVFEQSYPNLEFLFVNDCTPDRSMTILEQVIQDYPQLSTRIHILHHEKNKGLAAVRNTLVANARGKFIFHVDSDDWVEKDAVGNLMKVQRETEADIVTGGAILEEKGRNYMIPLPEFANPHEMLCSIYTYSTPYALPLVIWSRLIRTSLYTDNHIILKEGMYNEDVQGMCMLLYYAKTVKVCKHIVYHYNRDNDQSASYPTGDLEILARRCKIASNTHRHLTDFFKGKDAGLCEQAKILHQCYICYLAEVSILSKRKDELRNAWEQYKLGRKQPSPRIRYKVLAFLKFSYYPCLVFLKFCKFIGKGTG